MRARVTGILLQAQLQGRRAGQARARSLFTIDPAPFQVAVARAEADLGVAQARLEQARRDVARLKPVLEAKAVSQKELDDAISAVRVAEAETKSAQARLNEAKLNLELHARRVADQRRHAAARRSPKARSSRVPTCC